MIELTLTSDPPSPIRPIGASVSLNCSCDIAQSLPAEYINVLELTVSISLQDPSGRQLATTAPQVSGTVYSTSAVISSLGRDQSGVYTCTASVRTSSSFIIGREVSIQKRVTTGNKKKAFYNVYL